MKNFDFETISNKKFKGEVSDNDIDEVLEQDWLDEEDDQSKPEEGDEPKKPIAEDATDTDDKVEQETPKDSGSFDIAELRLSQDYAESAGVKKLLTTVPVGKPNRQRFFRVNPDPDYQLPFAVIELKEENETYIVHPKFFLRYRKSLKISC